MGRRSSRPPLVLRQATKSHLRIDILQSSLGDTFRMEHGQLCELFTETGCLPVLPCLAWVLLKNNMPMADGVKVYYCHSL